MINHGDEGRERRKAEQEEQMGSKERRREWHKERQKKRWKAQDAGGLIGKETMQCERKKRQGATD